MMLRKQRRYGCCKVVCLVLLMSLISGCINVVAGNGDSMPVPAIANGHELSFETRTVVQTIGAEVIAPQTKKFVQIEVTEVVNPQKIPLIFTVHYQPMQGEKFYLGTFSLFPPDNPGNFIVAAQGKLQSGGMIVVSLTPLEAKHGQEQVRVKLKRISFVSD